MTDQKPCLPGCKVAQSIGFNPFLHAVGCPNGKPTPEPQEMERAIAAHADCARLGYCHCEPVIACAVDDGRAYVLAEAGAMLQAQLDRIEQQCNPAPEPQDGMTKVFAESFDALMAENERLNANLARLKRCGVIEMMGENANVDSHVREWEARCLQAEAERDALQAENQDQAAELASSGRIRANGEIWKLETLLKEHRAKLAEVEKEWDEVKMLLGGSDYARVVAERDAVVERVEELEDLISVQGCNNGACITVPHAYAICVEARAILARRAKEGK